MKRIVPLFVLFALLPGPVLAALQPAQPAASQGDFVPVNALPPQAEQLPAAPLVIAAYAFVWVALLAYVWALWRRMTKLERELADLQRRVRKP